MAPTKTASLENCPKDSFTRYIFPQRIRNGGTFIDSSFLLFSLFVV